MYNAISKNEINAYYAWIASRLGAGSAAFKKLYNVFGSGKKIYESFDYSKVDLTEKQVEKLLSKNLSNARKSIDSALYEGFYPISYENEYYPKKLKQISNPPPIIYCKGRVSDFDKYYCIGIVGTRKASKESLEQAKRIASSLAKKGVIIISGLAWGIDGESHSAALESNGFTVGISGVKAGQAYPKENDYLYNMMYKRGAVICEHSPTDTVSKGAFPIRNRIISALSDALIVVEAPLKSGSMITAQKCLSLKKTVFVPEERIDFNEGGKELLEHGAKLLYSENDYSNIFDSIKSKKFLHISNKNNFDNKLFKDNQIKTEIVISAPQVIHSKTEAKQELCEIKETNKSIEIISGLTETENIVYNYILNSTTVSTDQIIKELKLSSAEAASCAPMLEIYGYVKRLPGDKWSII